MIKNFLFGIMIFLAIINAYGQSKSSVISGNFKAVAFRDFVREIENRYPIQFFYDDETISELKVTYTFKDESLHRFLSSFLQSTLFNYYIVNDQVYIFKGAIITSLGEAVGSDTIVNEMIDDVGLELEQLRQKQYRVITIGGRKRFDAKYATVSGVVRFFNTSDRIVGCNVYTKDKKYGSSTDTNGRYMLRLPLGDHTLFYSCVGIKTSQRLVHVKADGSLNVDVEPKINVLDDVKVLADEKSNLEQVNIGLEQINMKTVKTMPKLLGEPDIIKSTLVLPGITTVGEGSSGFNVRGGKTDQNLILINSTPIYYPSHFFGNFSAINSDVIEDANLYKGSFPVKYGGRLSSVYQLDVKKGNRQRISGSGGIGPLSSNFTLEGPIKKNKSSYLVSLRGTYSDWMLKQFEVAELYNSEVNFYDGYSKFDFDLGKKSKLSMNLYGSRDAFKLRSDTTYKYRNFLGEINVSTILSEKWNMTNSVSTSLFGYDISTYSDSLRSFELSHSLSDYLLKSHINYQINNETKVHFGAEVQLYVVNPGERIVPNTSELSEFNALKERASEYGLFIGVDFPVTQRLKIETGARLSGFVSFADGMRNIYQDGLPLRSENIIETITTKKNSVEKHYLYPEFRFSSNYKLSELISMKFSYNTTSQFLHLLSNTTAVSPTDTWKQSDEFLEPQRGHLFSIGSVWNDREDMYEMSLEGFYKFMNHMKEYKAGADLLLNNHIETEIIDGTGKSYGVELSLEKKKGRFSGRLGYTFSRTLIKTNSQFEEELINGGTYFPANYDKPHQLNVIANWEPFRGIVFSTMVDYSTGRPITYPVSKYQLGNQTILHYSDYNQFRIPDYFRVDLSVTIDRNLKKDKLFDSSWSFSIYNLTGRKNAYSVYYRSNGKNYNAYKLSIFGSMIPTVSYKFKF